MNRFPRLRLNRMAMFSILAMCALSVFALDPVNKTRAGVAIKGYDAVAYFTQKAPVKGKAEFAHQWNGAEWRFASQEHLDKFKANPEQYAPQYGGYCAWAVAKNSTASIDPEAWRVVDGKLYLNYSKRIQKKWEKDIPGNIEKADGNWPKLLKK